MSRKYDPLYQSYRGAPVTQPVAQPVDTYVEHHVEQDDVYGELYQIANALKTINPSIDKFLEKRYKELSIEEFEKGIKNYQETKKKYDEFVKEQRKKGIDVSALNPYYKEGWKQAELADKAMQYQVDLFKAYNESTPPEDIASWTSEFTKKWIQENVAEDYSPHQFNQVFTPLYKQAQQQLIQTHIKKRSEYESEKKQELVESLTNKVLNNPNLVTKEDFFANLPQVSQQLQDILDHGIKEMGLLPSDANKVVLTMVINKALQEKDPDYLKILDNIETAFGNTLSSSASVASVIEKVKEKIEDDNYEEWIRQNTIYEHYIKQEAKAIESEAITEYLQNGVTPRFRSLLLQLSKNPEASPFGVISLVGKKALGLTEETGGITVSDKTIGELVTKTILGEITVTDVAKMFATGELQGENQKDVLTAVRTAQSVYDNYQDLVYNSVVDAINQSDLVGLADWQPGEALPRDLNIKYNQAVGELLTRVNKRLAEYETLPKKNEIRQIIREETNAFITSPRWKNYYSSESGVPAKTDPVIPINEAVKFDPLNLPPEQVVSIGKKEAVFGDDKDALHNDLVLLRQKKGRIYEVLKHLGYITDKGFTPEGWRFFKYQMETFYGIDLSE
jgi:hypothetical protein